MSDTSGVQIVLPTYADTQSQAINELLSLEPKAFPDTSALKPTDVVVRVRSAAVSFVDFIMMTGQYQHMLSPPYVPGLEFAGDVVWTGSGVRKVQAGDRVMSDFMNVGPRSKGDYQQSGAWSSYAVAPEWGIHPLPASFSYAQGCSFLANFETAYFALVKRAGLNAGERVLITGASGASGMAMVQIAKLLGAEVLVTGRSRSKLDAVRATGADHAIEVNAADAKALTDSYRRAIKELTDGVGVDAVVDTVGGDIGYAAFRTLRFEGRFIIVGWASNVSATGGRQTFEPDRLPTNIMQMKCLQVMGSPMVIYSMANPDWRRKQLEQILAWAHAGAIRPYVSNEFPASNFREAAATKFHGDVVGSCVLNF